MSSDYESPHEPEEMMENAEGIDLLAAYRSIIRALAHLESGEYTSDNVRQDAVWGHDDLPDPASGFDTWQG